MPETTMLDFLEWSSAPRLRPFAHRDHSRRGLESHPHGLRRRATRRSAGHRRQRVVMTTRLRRRGF